MKKLLYMFVLVFCSSCEIFETQANIETDCFVVTGVRKVKITGLQQKQYLVTVDAELLDTYRKVGFYTDELFHVGDTLRIGK